MFGFLKKRKKKKRINIPFKDFRYLHLKTKKYEKDILAVYATFNAVTLRRSALI